MLVSFSHFTSVSLFNYLVDFSMCNKWYPCIAICTYIYMYMWVCMERVALCCGRRIRIRFLMNKFPFCLSQLPGFEFRPPGCTLWVGVVSMPVGYIN